MRTAIAILVRIASLFTFSLAQDAACTAGPQATYSLLVGNADAAEYCYKKVYDNDNSPKITAPATLDSLRFRKRKDKKTTTKYDGEHHGGDDDEDLRSLLKSLSQGPASVASTFCSCNFPPAPTSRPTFYPTACGFLNGTANATTTSNSTVVTFTTTMVLNATRTDDSTITSTATLSTSSDDKGKTRTSDDDGATSTA